MVVYWSIKSAIDYVQYAVGAKDTFRGTGVFNSIQLSRNHGNDGNSLNSNHENKSQDQSESSLSKNSLNEEKKKG